MALARRWEEGVVSLEPRDPVRDDASLDVDTDTVERLPYRSWSHSLHGRLAPWLEWFGVRRLFATTLTVVAVVAAGWWLLRAPAPPTEAGLPRAATTTSASAVVAAQPRTDGPTSGVAVASSMPPVTALVVHIAGAVNVPGVYELPPGARVNAGVNAAGGVRADADVGAVNLAAPLVDGERVYVPVVGEQVAPAAAVVPVHGSAAPPGPVDLNRADADQLDALPGIGPATALAIVQHRETAGPFASVDDLEAVRGIGPAKLDAIRGLVTV